MQSTQIDTGNTGQCFVAPGFQPQSVVSDPAAGFPMKQSDTLFYPEVGQPLPEKWKRAIWGICDADTQSFIVEEEVEEAEAKPPTT